MREEEKASYNEEEMCHLFGRCVIFCGVGAFLLLYGSFNQNDYILCSGIGVVAIAVILSILLPKINPGKYRNKDFSIKASFGENRRNSGLLFFCRTPWYSGGMEVSKEWKRRILF